MKNSLLLSLGFLCLPACESPENRGDGSCQLSATIRIHSSLFLPRSKNFIEDQVRLLTTETILSRAFRNCGIEPGKVPHTIEIEQNNRRNLITISVSRGDKNQSRQIIKAILDSYFIHRTEQEAALAEKKIETRYPDLDIQQNLLQKSHESLILLVGNYAVPDLKTSALDEFNITDKNLFTKARQKLANLEALQKTYSALIDIPGELEGLGAEKRLIDHQVKLMDAMLNRKIGYHPDELIRYQLEYRLAHAGCVQIRKEIRALKILLKNLRSGFINSRRFFTIQSWNHL